MKRRIYRSVGTNTDWKLVVEQDAALTTFTDNIASTALGDGPTVALDSLPPPKNGHSIVELANGALALVAGNELCMTEQYKPHSWPLSNRYAFAGHRRGALGGRQFAHRPDRRVPRAGHRHRAGGGEPGEDGEVYAPCISKAGVVDTGDGCLFPSHEGLWYATPGGAVKITEPTYRKDEWQAIKPATFKAAFFDGCYYAMHDAADGDLQGRIWVLDMSQADFVSEVDERVDALYSNPLDGKMYVAQGKQAVRVGRRRRRALPELLEEC
jgi:hypothetical protein